MKKTTVKNTTNKAKTAKRVAVKKDVAPVLEQTKTSVTMPITEDENEQVNNPITSTDDNNLLLAAAAMGDNDSKEAEVANTDAVPAAESANTDTAASAAAVVAAVLPAKQRTNFGNLPKSGEGVNAVELVAYLQDCVEKGILRNANSGLPFLNMANEEVKWLNNVGGFPAVELIKGKTKKGLPVKQSYWLHVLGTYLIVDNVTVVPMAIPAPTVAAAAPTEDVKEDTKELQTAG